MKIVEVNVDELQNDEAIEGILGVANINDFPDLPESFKEDGLVATVPAFRTVDGVKKCFSGRKFVQFAKETGIKRIYAQEFDVSDEKVIKLSIKTNTTKHGSELIRAKMVQYLFDEYALGKGHRTDRDESDEQLLMAEDVIVDGKKKRRPTVYDKIGPMVGVKPKRAMMLRVVLKNNPAYFDRMDKDRSSLYEAYSKCKDEQKGYAPPAPTEKPAVTTTDSTGLPKFSPGDATYDVNAVYQFVENASVRKSL